MAMSGGFMPRLTLIILLLTVLAIPVFAQDPGNQDSLIIDLIAVAPGVPSAMLSIYAVTDDPVAQIVLPLMWDSDDGQIHVSGAYFFEELVNWDETADTVDLANSHIIITGICDNDGNPNPVLNTDNQRRLAIRLRIVIRADAAEQYVPISSYTDDVWGAPRFVLNNGATFTPVIVPGGILYQTVGVTENDALPKDFTLYQNYPNPFNMDTEIGFALAISGQVTLDIYDILGRKIRTLVADNLEAGYHSYRWNSTDDSGAAVSSGLYFYKIRTGDTDAIRKMLLLK
jgi:hypothetical protein